MCSPVSMHIVFKDENSYRANHPILLMEIQTTVIDKKKKVVAY